MVTEILMPVSAEAASPARNKGIDADTPIEQVLVGFIEHLIDNTRKLVTKDDIRRIVNMTAERLLGPGVLPVEVTNVTAADTAFRDLDEYLSRRKLRLRHVHYFEPLRRP
jgi:hypothetical protein